MDKNIKIHIKDRVAVAEGDPVIICGNSDYTVTFSFDEEWGQARAKTARFKFNTAEGPEHLDQPFEGDTVAVPELSNVREVEVGVFVGDLNTTTGASIRCKPCIRCGSGAPKDPDPDVYDKIMKLINQGGGGSGGGTGGGLPVVDSLPTHPEVGDVVILRQTEHIPWDQVKVWSRDEVPYNPDGIQHLIDALPSSGRLNVGEIPEKLDLSRVDKSKLFACGVIAINDSRYIQLSVTNIYGDPNALTVQCVDQENNTYTYLEAGATVPTEGWYVQDKQGHYNSIPAQEVKIPYISGLKVLDAKCTLSPDMLEELEALMTAPDPALDVFSQLATITNPEGIYKAEENNGTAVWELWIESNADTLVQLTKQVDDNTVDATQALQVARETKGLAETAELHASRAESNVVDALNKSDKAHTTANSALRAATDALSVAGSIEEIATKAEGMAHNNGVAIGDLQSAVRSLQTKVDGYSTFLEEINGEVVDDE